MDRVEKQHIQENRIFLLKKLSTIESKFNQYHLNLEQVRRRTHEIKKKMNLINKSAIDEDKRNKIESIKLIMNEISEKYINYYHENQNLNGKLKKYVRLDSLQETEIKELHEDLKLKKKELHVFYEKLNSLHKLIQNRDRTIHSLNHHNLVLRKRIQDHEDDHFPNSINETVTNFQLNQINRLNHNHLKTLFTHLRELLRINLSSIHQSQLYMNNQFKRIKNDQQKLNEIDSIKHNLHHQERRGYTMWNIWKNDQHEDMVKKIDSLSEQVQSLENHLSSYRGLLDEYNESLKVYEENYKSLQNMLEHLEGELNMGQSNEKEFDQKIEELTHQVNNLKESEITYQQQIKNLNERLDQQKQIEQKYKQKLFNLKSIGQGHSQTQEGREDNKRNDSNSHTEREISQYQTIPKTQQSKSVEFNPFKYNKIITKRSE